MLGLSVMVAAKAARHVAGFRWSPSAMSQTVCAWVAQGSYPAVGEGPGAGRLRRRPYICLSLPRNRAVAVGAPEHAGYGRLCDRHYDPA